MNGFKTVFFVFVAAFLAWGMSACDANIPRPDELVADTSVSVAKFTADEATITLGDSTILRWEVEDDENKVDYAYISPDVGTVAESGSKQITPSKSTTYTLTAYVNNEALSSRSLQITVLSASGSEIVAEPEDEVCDDGEDNDFDDAADCDDDDCAEDAACAEVEVTYAFTGYAVSPETIYIGDEVSVSWESNYDIVIVTHEDNEEAREGTDTYTFTATDASTTVTLYGYAGGGLKETQVILVTAEEPVEEEEPTFSATIVSFKADPGLVIYGQSFTVSWEVSSAEKVELKYTGVSSYSEVARADSIIFDEADQDTTFSLKVTDENGLTETREKTVTVYSFDKGTSAGLSGVVEMVPTATKGEFYFITSSAIYYSADYGETLTALTVSGLEGDIKSLAVDRSGNLYVGTEEGLFYSTDKASFTQMLTASGASINCIYPRSTESVLIGTDTALFEVYASGSETCSSGSEYMNGYCVQYHPFAGREDNVDYRADPVQFKNFVPRLNSSTDVVLTSSEGTYLSTDSGDSFPNSGQLSSATDGYWPNANTGFLWNEESDKIWSYADGEFASVGIQSDSGVGGIRFVTGVQDMIFVATDHGVFYKDDDDWYGLNLTSDVQFLIGEDSSFLTSTLRAFVTGKVYTLEWSGIQNVLEAIPFESFDPGKIGLGE